MSKDRLNDTGKFVISGRRDTDWQRLALDALAKLARQFSNKPNFEDLIEILLFTFSGQFAVANSFALFRESRDYAPRTFYFAGGKFKANPHLADLDLTIEHEDYFIKNPVPHRVDDIAWPGKAGRLTYILNEHDVKIIAPMIQNNKLIGVLGLGEKVNNKLFSDDEIELLATLVNSIIPFIANSFLFMEISSLNEWYLNVLNSVKQGVFVFDSEHLLKKVNAAGHKILKNFKPNLQDSDSLYQIPLELIFPNNIYSGWAIRLTDPANRRGRIFENMTASVENNERIFNIGLNTVGHANDDDSDIIITLDDITDQTRSEQRLFDLQSFAEKGQMASSIAHELNNHLGLIMGGIEMTQLALNKNDQDKAAKTMERLVDSVGQMTRYTAGLMDYTRLDTQKSEGNINKIINDVLAFVAVQRKFRTIGIETRLDKNIPPIELDSDQIAQLLLNFLNNSADAIGEAGREKGRVTVSTKLADDCVEMIISDNGIGMDPEVKDRLFKARLTTKEHGHGYGMVTCAKIIQNHRADVEIESEKGDGTAFTIKFPMGTEYDDGQKA